MKNNNIYPGYKAGEGKKYPALIVTDGDFDFGNVYHSASTLAGVITPLFIISIGTSLEEGEAEHFSRRIYEFSPPGWDRQDPFAQPVRQLPPGRQRNQDRLSSIWQSPKALCSVGTA